MHSTLPYLLLLLSSVVVALPPFAQPLSRRQVLDSLPSRRLNPPAKVAPPPDASSSVPASPELEAFAQEMRQEVQHRLTASGLSAAQGALVSDLLANAMASDRTRQQDDRLRQPSGRIVRRVQMPDLRTRPELRRKNVVAKLNSPFIDHESQHNEADEEVGMDVRMSRLPVRTDTSTQSSGSVGEDESSSTPGEPTQLYLNLLEALQGLSRSPHSTSLLDDPSKSHNGSAYLEIPLEDIQVQGEWLGLSTVAAIGDPSSDRIGFPRAVADAIYSQIDGSSIAIYHSDVHQESFSYPCSTEVRFRIKLARSSTSSSDEADDDDAADRVFDLDSFKAQTWTDSMLCLGAVYALESLTDDPREAAAVPVPVPRSSSWGTAAIAKRRRHEL